MLRVGRFVPISFWFTVCVPSVLLVMLIVSRPPAECDLFLVGWLWSCLPKEMRLCVPVCVCVYSAQLQCVTKSLMILCTRVCVWLCVSRWISTDLHALVRHGVIPILQTLRVKRGSREAFHHYAVIYRLFSLSSLLCFILLVKRNLWEKREILHPFFSSTNFLWNSGKGDDNAARVELITEE